jgi:hypothetical protein
MEAILKLLFIPFILFFLYLLYFWVRVKFFHRLYEIPKGADVFNYSESLKKRVHIKDKMYQEYKWETLDLVEKIKKTGRKKRREI